MHPPTFAVLQLIGATIGPPDTRPTGYIRTHCRRGRSAQASLFTPVDWKFARLPCGRRWTSLHQLRLELSASAELQIAGEEYLVLSVVSLRSFVGNTACASRRRFSSGSRRTGEYRFALLSFFHPVVAVCMCPFVVVEDSPGRDTSDGGSDLRCFTVQGNWVFRNAVQTGLRSGRFTLQPPELST